MAWKMMGIHEQRVRFVVAATQRLKSFGALCAEYEISRPTGYLWLDRYQKSGVQGIAEQSRKPHCSPQRTAAELEQPSCSCRRTGSACVLPLAARAIR
ncbi:MAG: helix-turn-helix domain-containing protein [Terriglobales bacterium]